MAPGKHTYPFETCTVCHPELKTQGGTMTVKFMYGSKQLKVGDQVTVNITLRGSKKEQVVYGIINSIPTTEKGDFAVSPGGKDGQPIFYPTYEDLQGVTVVKTPDNWPPRANDVWQGTNHVWHCMPNGKMQSGSSSSARTYSYADSLSLAEFLVNNKNPELLYRHTKR
jgi:hypothetical protein